MGRCSASDEKFVVGLADFFSNSNVGLAVFDEELRYQAVNPWLANVHRYRLISTWAKRCAQSLDPSPMERSHKASGTRSNSGSEFSSQLWEFSR